jgi:hypothetical protein
MDNLHSIRPGADLSRTQGEASTHHLNGSFKKAIKSLKKDIKSGPRNLSFEESWNNSKHAVYADLKRQGINVAQNKFTKNLYQSVISAFNGSGLPDSFSDFVNELHGDCKKFAGIAFLKNISFSRMSKAALLGYLLLTRKSKKDMMLIFCLIIFELFGDRIDEKFDDIVEIFNNLWSSRAVNTAQSDDTTVLESTPISLKGFHNIIVECEVYKSISNFLLSLVGLHIFDKETTQAFIKTLGAPKKVSLMEFIGVVLGMIDDLVRFGINYATSGSIYSAIAGSNDTTKWLERTDQLILDCKSSYVGIITAFSNNDIVGRKSIDDLILVLAREIQAGLSLQTLGAKSKIFRKRLHELQGIYNDLNNRIRSKSRRAPIGFVVYGLPGIGKSGIIEYMYKCYAKFRGWDYTSDMVYHKNPQDKWWTNHDPPTQPIIHMPEVGSTHEDIASKQGDPIMEETLNVIDSAPYCVQQAVAEEKGKTHIRPDFVIVDVNDHRMNLHKMLNNPAAAARRFIYIHVTVKAEYAQIGGSLDRKSTEKAENKMDLWNFHVYRKVPETIKKSRDETVYLEEGDSGSYDIFGFSQILFKLFENHDKEQEQFNIARQEDINKYIPRKYTRQETVHVAQSDDSDDNDEYGLKQAVDHLDTYMSGDDVASSDFVELAKVLMDNDEPTVDWVQNVYSECATIREQEFVQSFYGVTDEQLQSGNFILPDNYDTSSDDEQSSLSSIGNVTDFENELEGITEIKSDGTVIEQPFDELIAEARRRKEAGDIWRQFQLEFVSKFTSQTMTKQFVQSALEEFTDYDQIQFICTPFETDSNHIRAGKFDLPWAPKTICGFSDLRCVSSATKKIGSVYARVCLTVTMILSYLTWGMFFTNIFYGMFAAYFCMVVEAGATVYVSYKLGRLWDWRQWKAWQVLGTGYITDRLYVNIGSTVVDTYRVGYDFCRYSKYLGKCGFRKIQVKLGYKPKHTLGELSAELDSISSLSNPFIVTLYRVMLFLGLIYVLKIVWRCFAFYVRTQVAQADLIVSDEAQDPEKVEGFLQKLEKDMACALPHKAKRGDGDIEYSVPTYKIPTVISPSVNTDHPLPEVYNRIKKNIVYISSIKKDLTVSKTMGFGIKGDIVVFNMHAVYPGERLYFSRSYDELNGAAYTYYNPDHGIQVGDDIIMIRVPGLLFHDLTSFISEVPFFNTSVRGMIDGYETSISCTQTPQRINSKITGIFTVEKPLYYLWPENAKGKCGTPLLGCFGSYKVILGIHVSNTDNTDWCASTPFDVPRLKNAIESFEKGVVISLNSVGRVALPTAQGLADIHPRHPLQYEQTPGLVAVGQIPGSHATNAKSMMVKSPIIEEIDDIFGVKIRNDQGQLKYNKPPMKAFRSPNGDYIGPANVWLKKVGVIKHPLNPAIMEICILTFVKHIVAGYKKKGITTLSPVSLEVAQNGYYDNFYFKGMNNNTSAGSLLAGKKKMHIHPHEMEGMPDAKMPNEDIKSYIFDIIEAYKRGECAHPIIGAQFKDEPRALEKIKAGKTRVFAMSPYPHTLVCRMVLFPFMAGMVEHRYMHKTAVGVDCAARDALPMFKHLTDFSKNIMEGDYGGYDTSMPVGFAYMANSVIYHVLKQMGYNDEALLIVKGVLSDWVHPLMNMNGNLFFAPGFQPSGKYGTAEDNSLRNVLLQMYCFVDKFTKYGEDSQWNVTTQFQPDDFWKLINPLVYGDDMLTAVKDEIAPYFNNVTFANYVSEVYGMDFTSAAKGVHHQPFMSIREMSFLKRRFRYNKLLERKVAALNLDESFVKSLPWVLPSKAISLEHQVLDGLNSALQEYLYHCNDRVDYNLAREKCIIACEKHLGFTYDQIDSCLSTVDELIARDRAKFNLL